MDAPDLEGGFAIVGTNIPNSWRTKIRSILQREGAERAYLTHECRAENIDPAKIFDDRLYDFAPPCHQV